jgi:uncharacterized membrane protein/protein-disulfide isomerase
MTGIPRQLHSPMTPSAPSPSRRAALLMLGLALVGLVASISAAVVHYRLLADPLYRSVCDINETWNCSQVYESAYGAFRGVPVAVGGVVWFAAVTLLSVAGLRGAGATGPAGALSGRVAGYIFALSVLGLSAVLYLGYASLFVLKTYCLFCFTTYFAVAGLFLVSGAAADGTMTGLPRRAVGDLRALVTSPLALSLAVAFTAGASALIALFPRQVDAVTAAAAAAAAPIRTLEASEQSNFDQWYGSLPRVPVAVPTDGAKVLIVKFNDYQCPPCRMTWEQYKPVIAKYMAQYPGKVKYVTKDYPLDGECNVNTPGAGHAAACEAAVAVRLARAKGRADAMEEWLFANQPQITPDLVKQGARSIGGITDFDAQYAKTLELVKADIAMGASLKVTGTPTFFVNGARVPIIKPEFFDAAIAYELAH